jgi:hypothetical protein
LKFFGVIRIFNHMARPLFRSNTEQRERAMLFAFAGMSRRDIAIGLRLEDLGQAFRP